MKKNRLSFLLVLTLIWLAGCGGPSTPPPTPTPTPDEWLDRAGEAALAIKSAQFILIREGTPAVLDPATNTTFTEAAGKYQAPDRVSATVKVTLFGSVVSVQMLWLPEGNYLSNPLTGAFDEAPAEASFNGVAMFAAGGIPGVLKEGIQNATLVGTETIEEVETYHLKGEADGDKLAALTADTLAAGTSYPVDVWMSTTTHNPVRLHIAEPDGNGWMIDLFAFDEPVEINAP